MTFTTNSILKRASEKDCFAITAERKYYETGGCFIKRSLRRREWQLTLRGTIHMPKQGEDRIKNEAAALRYVAQHTNIPVPRLHCCFEDDEAVYLITEYVEGVAMVELDEDKKEIVKQELRGHLETLQGLRSDRVGGAEGGPLVPPYRAHKELLRDDWVFPLADTKEYVFCHGDLSQHNVLVDPETLKITAIIDWEYAGFFPEYFEFPFYERPGPSVARGEEVDDTQRLVDFIKQRSLPFK
ncbi:hypothetical protein FH972_024191 [Carpinus fangiana]|uniref:Aminoglycoside phosphotransferase domain-containing protein n=1 Tax=Carpinus fangiana TaxID=176857 RepID=A0A5N6KZU0_9ROSI|nr:hypothetical protein FH972_024191 [Carpinus fangiana]